MDLYNKLILTRYENYTLQALFTAINHVNHVNSIRDRTREQTKGSTMFSERYFVRGLVVKYPEGKKSIMLLTYSVPLYWLYTSKNDFSYKLASSDQIVLYRPMLMNTKMVCQTYVKVYISRSLSNE